MLRATAYIMACSAKNRMRRRIQRLREPRYLAGAFVGMLYLYFAFFGRQRVTRGTSGRRPRALPASFLPALGPIAPALAGLLFLAGAAVSWAMPFRSSLLDFTATETDLLFPAPVTRRQLLIYRLIRSQWSTLFGAVVVALTYPSASVSARIRGLVATWLVFMTCHVFYTSVTLTRTRLGAAGSRERRVAWGPLLFVLAGVAAFGVAIVRGVAQQPIQTVDAAFRLLGTIALSGIPHLVLWPFVALVQPLFADSFLSFGRALPGALAVYGLTALWLLRADDVFGPLDPQRVTEPGGTARRAPAYRARPVAWRLAGSGRPETPFVWKGAIQTFRVVDRRVLFRIVLGLSWITLVAMVASRARGLVQLLGVCAAIGAAFAALMGPQMLRIDLRQDLQHMELLKTWPVPASAIVRGEIAWPATAITCVAWMLGVVALLLSASVFSRTTFAWRMACGGAALILTPALVLAQYTIHNTTALMFPAWITTGARPRGVDAMGQRLIMVAGTWLLLALSLVPGVFAGGLLTLGFYWLVGPWILIPAAVVCTAVVLVEMVLATEALGSLYERLDIAAVERGE